MQRPRLRSSQSALQSLRPGLFRSTGTVQVLKGFGVIFQDTLAALFLAASGSNVRFPTIEQVQGAGSDLYAASKEAKRVDLFISHSWAAGRWSKFLALCLFFNLGLALKCCLATWLAIVSILIAVFGWTGLGGNQLVFSGLVCLPVASFFVFFFFGQTLSAGCWSPSLWVDRLCVHQTDMELKAEQIASLPIFVAHSSCMLILWDETYFERLWCNLELATFARHGDANKLEVLPLWLAPWLLCSIVLDLLSASLFEILEHVFPNWSSAWVIGLTDVVNAAPVGHNPVFAKFVAWQFIWLISGVVYG